MIGRPPTFPPFPYTTPFRPVTPLRHRMSDLPSPSKSPSPVMLQLRSVTVAKLVAPPEIVVPFMSQIEFEPVAQFGQTLFASPSPPTSPTPSFPSLTPFTTPT